MNIPPPRGIRVPAEELRTFTVALFEKVGTSRADAELLANLLVQTDMRGLFSHGTKEAPRYINQILEGKVNPKPNIRVVNETPTTQVLDGDGGLGHIACYRGINWALARAKEHGVAVVTTNNHFHIGAAGKYSRMCLASDCIGIVSSSHRHSLDPQKSLFCASTWSPISIAVPAREQPPLVLDIGSNFLPWNEGLFRSYPWVYFKELGLGAAFHSLAGVLAGIYQNESQQRSSQWKGDQGAFLAVLEIRRFLPIEEFKKEMDRYLKEARRMKPLPGYARTDLAGSLECLRETEYAREGIPLSPRHQESLEAIARKLKIDTPFIRFKHTQFDHKLAGFRKWLRYPLSWLQDFRLGK